MNDKKFLPPIIFALGIILSLGWYQFIYTPAQKEILSIELETRRLRQIEKEILNLQARHRDLSEFVEEKELQLEQARIFLPETIAQDRFIDKLYSTADVGGVQIVSIRTGEINSAENFQSQVVNVKAESDYISLLNFIRQILDGERLANLERFSVESSGGKILSCELSFRIFAAAP